MYLIDSEVRDEIDEIIIYLKRKGIKNHEIKVVCPNTIAGGLDVDLNNIYKYSPKNKRLVNKLYQLMILLIGVSKGETRILFSGYPMLKHRIVSIFSLGKIKHFAYIRGLHADSENYSGYSDTIFKVFKKVPFLIKFNNFQANKIITIGEMNKDFMIGRSVKVEKIELIEPIWLSHINRISGFTVDGSPRRVYFITQAFEKHGYTKAQKSQEEVVLKLKHCFDSFQTQSFIVRRHPRDVSEKYFGCDVDSTSYEVFLRNLRSDDIIIAPFSTLAFEVSYLGGNVIFYSTDILDEFYAGAYKRLGISPLKKIDEIVSHTQLNYAVSNQYSNIVSYVFHSNTK
jgi:hypothetical protein